jgi:outer membrane protein insertion porin family
LISGKDYSSVPTSEKYKWIEYHKYRFTAEWYQRLKGNLILKLSTKHGYLGYYNSNLQSPFERFQVGGDGLSGFTIYGRDIVSHRGYEIYSNTAGATIFNKYSAEVRYPFSLNPSSTIYGLAFFDAANAWDNFKSFNPFQLRRSAGLGIRIFLPMFGLLGLDYGLGFDRLTPGTKFGQATKITFMLGFEPD